MGQTVHAFYATRDGAANGKTGAVTVVQRTSSDMRLNPHLHSVVLDGAYRDVGGALVWTELGHLRTRDGGDVLEQAVRRMTRYLRKQGALSADGDDDASPEELLAGSAVSGQSPPAGPQWLRGLARLTPSALGFDKPLRPYRPEACLRRWHGRRRDGPSLASRAPGRQRSSTPPSHCSIRRCPRPGEPPPVAHRAATARAGLRCRREYRQQREAPRHIPSVGGASRAHFRHRHRVPEVRRQDEARRARHRSQK